MSETGLSPDEIAEIFGGEVSSVETHPDEMEVSLALRAARDCVLEAAEEDGVGVNQLASRLGISPSSVSRFFSSDGDARFSTFVLYGRALGRTWECYLRKDAACVIVGNYPGGFLIFVRGSTGTSTFSTISVVPDRQQSATQLREVNVQLAAA